MKQIDIGKVRIETTFVKGTNKEFKGTTHEYWGNVTRRPGKPAEVKCFNNLAAANRAVKSLLSDGFLEVDGNYCLLSEIQSIEVFYGPYFLEVDDD